MNLSDCQLQLNRPGRQGMSKEEVNCKSLNIRRGGQSENQCESDASYTTGHCALCIRRQESGVAPGVYPDVRRGGAGRCA